MTMNKLIFSCVCLIGLISMSCGQSPVLQAQQPPAQPQYGAVLTVKHMCCAKESVPAIKELSKVPGVKRVAVNYKTRSLYIETTEVNPSSLGLWDGAERIKIGPVRLATTAGVFTARPE